MRENHKMRFSYQSIIKKLLKDILGKITPASDEPKDLFESFQPFEKIKVDLVRVVDGDTLKLAYKKATFRVRLLIIDTPESVEANHLVMPLGKEVAYYTTKWANRAQKIEIAFDIGQRKDRFDRYLVYLYLDGKLLQTDLLKKGYAIVRYVAEGNDTKADDFLSFQQIAKDKNRGVWQIPGYVYRQNKNEYNFKK
jgi:micrococcal nuclease